MMFGSINPEKLEVETRSGIRGSYLAELDQNQLNELKDKLYSGEIDPYHFLGGMIDSTESMAEDEKGYWFDILPSMNYPQIARLVDILATERRKLRLLEIKYQKEIKELNARHLAKRKSGQAIE
jgi:hypothetical protein